MKNFRKMIILKFTMYSLTLTIRLRNFNFRYFFILLTLLFYSSSSKTSSSFSYISGNSSLGPLFLSKLIEILSLVTTEFINIFIMNAWNYVLVVLTLNKSFYLVNFRSLFIFVWMLRRESRKYALLFQNNLGFPLWLHFSQSLLVWCKDIGQNNSRLSRRIYPICALVSYELRLF